MIMEAHKKLWSFFIILILVKITQSIENDTSPEARSGRVSGRIVKLYSGVKKDPVLCPKEGFVEDPADCTVFYRCLKANNGKFTVFRFQCGPGTVYDPETEVCNHPQNTKRSECGGLNYLIDNNNKANEIEGSYHEVPYPLSTKGPINITLTATKDDKYVSFSNNIDLSPYVPQAATKPSSQKPIKDLRDTTPAQTSTDLFSQPLTSLPIYNSQSVTQTSLSTSQNVKTTKSTSDFPKTTKRNTDEQETSSITIAQNRDLCTTEGFVGDSINCRKFYRCVNNLRGGFIRYEFLCNELTIWDDESNTCNHAWAVRNNRCGRDILNDISDMDSTNKNNDDKENYSIKNPTSNYGPPSGSAVVHQQVSYGDKKNNTQTSTVLGTQSSISPVSEQYGAQPTKESTYQQQLLSENNKQTLVQTQSSIPPAITQPQYQTSYISINKTPNQNYIPDYPNQAYSTVVPSSVSDNSIQRPTSGYEVQNINEKVYHQQQFPYGNKINYIPTSTIVQTFNPISTSSPTQFQPIYNAYEVPTQNYIPNHSNHELNQINNYTVKPTLSYEDIYHDNKNFVTNNQCSESGFIGDVKDCKKFYRCVDNGQRSFTRYEFTCGQGTVWDPTLEACNHEWAVKECGGKKISNDKVINDVSTSLYQTSSLSPVPSEDFGYEFLNTNPFTTIRSKTTVTIQEDSKNKCLASGFFGVENDCKMFYRCVSNADGGFTKVMYRCDEGHLWDSNIKSCNRAELVKSCGPPIKNTINVSLPPVTASPVYSTTHTFNPESDYDFGYGQRITTANHEVTEKKPSSLALESQNRNNECKTPGFMGDINDCRTFYRCVDNGDNTYVQYQFTCGDGTAWDSSIEACNHVWAVRSCSGSEFGTKSTVLISSTKRPPEDSVFPSTTPSSAHFEDGAYSSSNYIEMSVVSNTEADLTTVKSSINYKNHCYKSGFMGDKNDCNKFYRCVDNGDGSFTQYQFSCGEGTVWDDKIEACNHKWAVEECSSNNDIMKDNLTSSTANVINTSNVPENHIYTDYTTTQKISILRPQNDNSETDINNTCKKDGFMGDSNNCKKFYRCVSDGNGGYTRYEFTCGEGTVWDQEIQSCNHESRDHNCIMNTDPISSNFDKNEMYTSSSSVENSTNKPSVDLTSYPNLSSSVTESYQTTHENTNQETDENQCTSEGFFGDLNDCKKFYRCVNDGNDKYIKYGFSCGEGTAWDNSMQSCNHMANVASCHTQISESQNLPVLESPMNDEQVPMQVNDETSSHSPTITNSVASVTEQSNENVYTTKTPQQYQTSETSQDKNICKDEGFYGNEEDCKKFYRCVSNEQGGFTKYNFDCGEGTIWDQDIVACNHPQDVTNPSCKMNTENEIPETNNDLTNPETSQTTSNGQSNEAVTVTDEPHQQSSTTTSTSEPIVEQDICAEEGFFGSKKDCKKFYRCVSNQKGGFTKYNFDCGEGTIWDEDITACNHPQDVTNPSCTTTDSNSSSEANESEPVAQTSSSSPLTTTSSTDTISTTTSTSTTSQSTITTQSSNDKPNNNYTCTEAGFFADPNDCKKFYRCVDWDNNGERFSVYHFECGEGTIWDPALETCNHEESVYPPRNCSMQQQSDNTPHTSTSAVTQTTENIPETSTPQLATTQETTTDTSTTTTTKKTSPETTTEQSTTTQSTTLQSTTDQTTTPKSTTTEMTTKTSTTEQTTTETSTTASQQTTTEASTTTDKSTTTSQQTTTDSSTIAEKPTTTEKSTTNLQSTEPSTTTEQTTTTSQQTTSAPQSTTESSSTTETSTTTSQQTTMTSSQTTIEQTSTTTSEQTTEQTTQTEKTEDPNSTEKSTTQSSVTEEQTTTQMSSTTESSLESSTQTSTSINCPQTNDGEYLYVCPTSFRRHPKYCNMFYQCTEDDNSHELKIATFQCPNNTIYDESKTKCVAENKAQKKCNGEMATKYRVKRLNPNFKEPITITNEKLGCPSTGHYVFENNQECSQAFLKCVLTKAGILQGFVHRCPEGYTYWSKSRRCEAINNIRDCKHSHIEWSGRYEIPIEDMNIGPKILV